MQLFSTKSLITVLAIPALAFGLVMTACGGDDDGAGGGGNGGGTNGGSGGAGGTPSAGTPPIAGNFGIQHARENTAPSVQGGATAR